MIDSTYPKVQFSKLHLGENTDVETLVEYSVKRKLSVDVIQELVTYYADKNQDNPNFYSEAQTELSEKGISI